MLLSCFQLYCDKCWEMRTVKCGVLWIVLASVRCYFASHPQRKFNIHFQRNSFCFCRTFMLYFNGGTLMPLKLVGFESEQILEENPPPHFSSTEIRYWFRYNLEWAGSALLCSTRVPGVPGLVLMVGIMVVVGRGQWWWWWYLTFLSISEGLACGNSSRAHRNLGARQNYCPPFTDEDPEAERK